MRSIKRILDKSIIFATLIALTAAFLAGALALAFRGRASAEDIAEYDPTSIGLSNPHFKDTSGSYPMTPSSWTGAHLGDGNADIVSGVVDLTPKTYVSDGSGNTKFKLDQYAEYSTEDKIPLTIFGEGTEYDGADAKALFINTGKGAQAAYAYTSSDMSFAASSFYRVSVWVKTGNFASDTGATVKLTGLDETCGFININTVRDFEFSDGAPVFTKDNNYGWTKYTMYVATPTSGTKTVKLSLGIGDVLDEDDDEPTLLPGMASGYAFFDTVTAERISAASFALETSGFELDDETGLYYNNNKTSLAIDMFDTEYFTANDGSADVEIGTFTDNVDLWKTNVYYDEYEDDDDLPYVGAAKSFIYDADTTVDIEDNVFGLTQNPWTPLGKTNEKNNNLPVFSACKNANIMMISSYNESKKSFEKAAYGISTPDVTIERFRFYRFGVWVKDDSVSDGSGISIIAKGEANNTANNNKLMQAYSNLTGDSEDNAHYGWKEHTVYVKGSAISDLKIRFELWLGTPDALSSGIAMFDNATFTEISYADYSANSGEGNILTLDATATDTGVTNGNFMDIAEYEELKYPLPASSWTYYAGDKVGTTGFSKNEINTDNAVYGIIPVGDAFAEIEEAKLATVNDPANFLKAPLYNALLLSSTTPTAFCYRSSDITVATDKGYKLTVDLAVDGMGGDDYGASIVLRSSAGAVLSTIEGIKDTANAFKTYTFYIDSPLSDNTVNVEVWLGLNDRTNNTKKLSRGNVYVKEVAMTEWTAASDSSVEAEYNNIYDAYLKDINNPTLVKALDYGVYSFKAPSLNFYDIYSYSAGEGYAVPYAWTLSTADASNPVKYGIFNTANLGDIEISDFDSKDLSGNMLILQNTLPNRSELSYDHSLALVANTYYRLDVTLNVRLNEASKTNDNVKGASISITGTKTETFDNIKDTSLLVAENDESSRDYNAFKTYSFYISSGSDGGNVGITIALGGNTKTSYADGRVIVADVKLSTINNTAFDTAEANLDENYQKAVRLSETSTDDDSDQEAPTSDIAWWIIPTVIFSAALVIAVIIVLVIRLRDRIKKSKKTSTTYSTEYDRSEAAKKLDMLRNGKDTTSDSDSTDDALSDEFDDAGKQDSTEPTDADETVESTDAETAENADADADTAEAQEDTQPEAAEEEQKPETDLDD